MRVHRLSNVVNTSLQESSIPLSLNLRVSSVLVSYAASSKVLRGIAGGGNIYNMVYQILAFLDLHTQWHVSRPTVITRKFLMKLTKTQWAYGLIFGFMDLNK